MDGDLEIAPNGHPLQALHLAWRSLFYLGIVATAVCAAVMLLSLITLLGLVGKGASLLALGVLLLAGAGLALGICMMMLAGKVRRRYRPAVTYGIVVSVLMLLLLGLSLFVDSIFYVGRAVLWRDIQLGARVAWMVLMVTQIKWLWLAYDPIDWPMGHRPPPATRGFEVIMSSTPVVPFNPPPPPARHVRAFRLRGKARKRKA